MTKIKIRCLTHEWTYKEWANASKIALIKAIKAPYPSSDQFGRKPFNKYDFEYCKNLSWLKDCKAFVEGQISLEMSVSNVSMLTETLRKFGIPYSTSIPVNRDEMDSWLGGLQENISRKLFYMNNLVKLQVLLGHCFDNLDKLTPEHMQLVQSAVICTSDENLKNLCEAIGLPEGK